jgi:acetoin utilization deacetylase AcuC-like enzyme
MDKYRRLRERVVNEAVVSLAQLEVPPPASDAQLAAAHDIVYVEKVVEGRLEASAVRRIGFPWSPQLVERSRRSVGGTIAACRQALALGVGVNLAGGTHHAFRDRGEGYCVFNDAAVAARVLQAEGAVESVLIVDCDVHQGNGTARIFRDDPTVTTYSIHGARNFPFRKEVSDVDVALDDGAGDAEYLAALSASLPPVLARGEYDLAIYVSGADPFRGDALGRLALSKGGLQQRDRGVLGALAAAGIPAAVVMAGGYARRVDDIVDIHLSTIRTALARGAAEVG